MILGLNSRDNGPELHIYEWNGNELANRFTYSFSDLVSVYYGTTYGLQDVDGDGKQEIIIAKIKSDCDEFTENRIIVLDDDLSVLSDTDTKACIASIPTFSTGESKRNLIISARSSKLNVNGANGGPAYTQFEEVEVQSGNVLWSSSPFFGTLKPDSLVFFGPGNDTRKAAVFGYGVYTFN